MTEHPTEQSKSLHDFSKEDLIEMVKKERHKNAQLFNKRAKLGLSFETPNNRKVRGKEQWDESIANHVRDHVPYLKSLDDKSVITDESNVTHTLIKGDNFPALLALLPEYRGEIDVIYIDPPYNTGNQDFIYNDKYVDKEDGFRHSMWLSFMARRLLLAHELLSDTGVIFVSIDDNEHHHLRMLMDEIFGEKNFVGDFIRSTSSGEKTSKVNINGSYEHTLCYAKEVESIPSNFARDQRNMDDYKNPDNDPNGAWKKDSPEIKIDDGRFGHARYPIYNPYLDETYYPPVYYSESDRKQWHYIEETFNRLVDEGRVVFHKTKKDQGRSKYGFFIKKYLKDVTSNTKNSSDLKFINSKYSNARGSTDLNNIFRYKMFSYPKPIDFIRDIVDLHKNKSAIVLDFFAGSGTTGHAVAELNADDGGKRHCILVTDSGKSGNTENDDTSGNAEDAVDIADDVTYERMRRVLTGDDWAKPEKAVALNQNLEMREVQFLSKNGARKRKTDFELTLELSMLYAENGYSFEDAQLYAQRLHNRWKKFAENEDGDLAVWD